MDLVDNKLVVSREYEWRLQKSELSSGWNKISDVFDIKLDKISTQWQIVVYSVKYSTDQKIYAYLHKVESSSDNFEVEYSLFINSLKHKTSDAPKVDQKKSEGTLINGDWICLGDYNSVFPLDTSNKYNHVFCFSSFDLILNISLVEVTAKTECPTAQKLGAISERLLNSEDLSDFSFICSDGTKIPAHRFILTAQSPVLKTMFNAQMAESKDQMTKLDDIDGETMMEFLRFLYAGRVENFHKFAPKLLYCAEKYEVEDLKELCLQEMKKNLSADNVFEYLALADRFGAKDFAFRCILLMKRDYDAIFQEENQETMDLKYNMTLSVFLRDGKAPSKIAINTHQSFTASNLPIEYKKFP